jgi:hypothetical protein
MMAMRTLATTTVLIVSAVLLFASPLLAQVGGPYDLTWSTIDGGGFTFSTAGAYSLGGTAGQPDAGVMAGSTFTLNGGFWGTVAAACTVTPTATVSGDATICPGDSTVIQADLTGTPPWNLTWSDGFVQNGVTTSPATRSVSPAVTTVYTVTLLSDPLCSSGSAGGSATVTVDSPPTAVASGGGTICTGGSLILSGSGGVSCHWSPSTGLSDPNSCNPTASPSATTTYVLTVTDAFGCVSTNNPSVTVTVNPGSSPTPSITVTRCVPANTSGLLASTPNNPGDSYVWTLTGGNIDSGQGTSAISFTSGSAATLMTLSVVETNTVNCSGSDSTTMEVDFNDVAPSNPFHTFICTLARNSITGGCGSGNYCPTNPVLRSQMAVFLLRSEHGPSYTPPACTNPIFTDVPCSNPFSSWIYRLVAEGVTGGCTATTFCPNNSVQRNSMAVFLLVTQHGAGYTPPLCTPPGQFTDVPCPGGGFTDWIYQLVAEGITGGCTATTYCPTQPVSRAQMAVFLVVTFSLP